MLITALIIIPYTIYGGFRSVVYTDCVQAILMIVTLIVTPIVGLIYIAKTPGLFARSIPQALNAAGPSYVSLTGAASGFAAGLDDHGRLFLVFRLPGRPAAAEHALHGH